MRALVRSPRFQVPGLQAALLMALLVLGAAPAFAAGGDEHGGSHARDLIWQAVNLLILLVVLFVAGRKPIKSFFANRREQIGSELDSAATLLSEAESRYAEWQRKLIDLDSDLEQIKSEALRRAEDDRDAILADAQAAAERIHRDAVAAVEQELRRAQAELRDEAAVLATEIAERILRERLEDSDRDRLLDEFITRVEPSAGAPGTR